MNTADERLINGTMTFYKVSLALSLCYIAATYALEEEPQPKPLDIVQVTMKMGARNHPAIPLDKCEKVFSEKRLPSSDFVYGCANGGYAPAIRTTAWITRFVLDDPKGANELLKEAQKLHPKEDFKSDIELFAKEGFPQEPTRGNDLSKSFGSKAILAGHILHCSSVPEDTARCGEPKITGKSKDFVAEYDRMHREGANISAYLLLSKQGNRKNPEVAKRLCKAKMYGDGTLLDYDEAIFLCSSISKPDQEISAALQKLNDLKQQMETASAESGRPVRNYADIHFKYMTKTHACKYAPEVGDCILTKMAPLPSIKPISSEPYSQTDEEKGLHFPLSY